MSELTSNGYNHRDVAVQNSRLIAVSRRAVQQEKLNGHRHCIQGTANCCRLDVSAEPWFRACVQRIAYAANWTSMQTDGFTHVCTEFIQQIVKASAGITLYNIQPFQFQQVQFYSLRRILTACPYAFKSSCRITFKSSP
jgi:hypothetical protein